MLTDIANSAIMALIYLIYQLPAVLAAGWLSRCFRPSGWLERLFYWGFLYSLLMIAIPGVLGLCGVLSGDSVLIASVLVAIAARFAVSRHPVPASRPDRFALPELLLVAIGGGVIAYQWRNYGLLPTTGTDALTYHLYYPAVWLAQGSIERISQPGMVTSSYPCYGELIYAWQMAPVLNDFFAKHFQYFFLALGACAAAAAGTAFGARRAAALAAGLTPVFLGVVFRNAAVANTDLITGAYLLFGVAFFALADRKRQPVLLLLGAAAFGVAAATKLSGLLLAPPMMAALVAILFFRRRRRRWMLGGALLTATIVAAPCFLANWLVAGNPFYPANIGIGPSLRVETEVVGWNPVAVWRFFVDGGVNNVRPETVFFLLVTWLFALAAPFLPWRRRRFDRPAALMAVVTLLLLLLQLQVYPAQTQPRMIVPLAMVSAVLSVVWLDRLARSLRPWWFAVFAGAGLLLLASGQLSYLRHGVGILQNTLSVFLVLLGAAAIRKRPLRLIFGSVIGLLLLLDAGYRYGSCNRTNDLMLRRILGEGNAGAKACLEENIAGNRGTVINYVGNYHFLFTGLEFGNRVIHVPVTASGFPDTWGYPTFEAQRQPGEYSAWLARLRTAKVRYLLTDPASFFGPNPGIEEAWAMAHPETFRPVFHHGSVRLFELRGETPHE